MKLFSIIFFGLFLSTLAFGLDMVPSSEKDCDAIKEKAIAKMGELNRCEKDSDCVLFKSAFTCKGQGLSKKANQKELKGWEKQYKGCLKKLKKVQDLVCTADYATHSTPCEKKRCVSDVDAYAPSPKADGTY